MFVVFAIMASDPKYNVAAMLQLEFAHNDAHFFDIMSEYDFTADWLEMMIYLDFAFLVTFTALFYFSLKVLMAAGKVRRRSFLGLFCLVPGALDVIENILMIQIIQHGGLQDKFQYFSNVVWMKWIIVVPFIILTIIAARHLFLRLFKKQPQKKTDNDLL